MKLNKKELRKIMSEFNRIANRLIRSDVDDYNGNVKKFLKYISSTEIINEYLLGCGTPSIDVAAEIQQVAASYGQQIFDLGDTDEEESANIWGILQYIAENKLNVVHGIALGYSHSDKYQDKLNGFNDRVVMLLVQNIGGYLKNIGIDMGLDERTEYNITNDGGQVNVANDNATINATLNNGISQKDIADLIAAIRDNAKSLPPEETETIQGSLEIIESEVKQGKLRKPVIQSALVALNAIKGTTEFAAAVTTLTQFISSFLS